ncbi:hypothetical protein RQM47_12940 [Rubrivirga sp. S365]|uniref:hypothetical protein n=1 Tax=Rubrivirga sp. S365 TaxID=3076080 RepID=UPI0028C5B018|nr:hypothetical protein [Rubrivirga sp. S365]MDT7857551.1 hypothetical protein [Rubrivirga sp. S365]
MTRTLRALAALALLPALGLVSGCTDTAVAPGVGATAQTTDALTLLPASADMVGMMDFQAARGSAALDAMTGGAGLGFMSGGGAQDFDTFVRQTGFDPDTDLDRVYVAASEGGPRAAFVAYGRFDRDRIEQYVASQPDLDLTATDVEGLPVYLAQSDDGGRGGFALVNDQMILGGDEATLGQMIRRLGTDGQAPSAELQALLDRVQHPDGAWFVARGLDRLGGDLPSDAPPAALAARAADGVVLSMTFGDDGVPVRAFVVTRAGTDTGDVADALRGGIAAAKMGVKDEPAALDVLDRATVEPRDGGVEVDAFLTTAFLNAARAD